MFGVTRDARDPARPASDTGPDRYMAYVGPAADYDLLGAAQFSLLVTAGLRHEDALLDYGCGSLRAGRFLISYLDSGCYHGLEPNTWLVDAALDRQLGRDIVEVKKPIFLDHD